MDPLYVDVWGVCATRDVFGIPGDTIDLSSEFEVRNYIKATSVVAQFSEHGGPVLTAQDMDEYMKRADPHMSGTHRKSVLNDFNKTAIGVLEKSDAEWLVIDLRATAFGVSEIRYPGGGKDYYSLNYEAEREILEDILSHKGIEYSIHSAEISEETIENALDSMISFCKRKYGEKIILLGPYETPNYFNKHGGLGIFEDGPDPLSRTALLFRLNYRFVKETGCYYIKNPMNNIAEYYHKWGLRTVHYIDEYYYYALECIRLITKGDGNLSRKLELLYLEYSSRFASMRAKEILSAKNTLARIRNAYESGKPGTVEDEVRRLSEQNEEGLFLMLGEFYFSGTGVEKDLDKAAEYTRRCIGTSAGNSQMAEILLSVGTPEADTELRSLLLSPGMAGTRDGDYYLAKAYREGRGFGKDLDKAALLMRRARDKKRKGAAMELCGILWETGTEESLSEMMSALEKPALKENKNGCYLLGRAYMEGKGTGKDLDKAAYMMRRALEKGHKGAPQYLCEILIMQNTEESLKELEAMADRGSTSASGYLGKLYLEGNIKDADPEKAVKYLKKASEKNKKWLPLYKKAKSECGLK